MWRGPRGTRVAGRVNTVCRTRLLDASQHGGCAHASHGCRIDRQDRGRSSVHQRSLRIIKLPLVAAAAVVRVQAEKSGYTGVRGLTRATNGTWHAAARNAGNAPVAITIDSQGKVTEAR